MTGNMKKCPKCGILIPEKWPEHFACGWKEKEEKNTDKGNTINETQNPIHFEKYFNQLISNSERIGTIGSPSSTSEISLDILGTAVNKKLVGELAYFQFYQDGTPHYALGQITEVQLKNTWLEDPTIRSLARQKGQIKPISGQQDTHLGQLILSAVFSDNNGQFKPSILGTVPSTGTFVGLATDEILNAMLKRYKSEIFYLGHVYGSKPRLPLWFKHFGRGTNGAGEAYHIGIFGKTGSGKSVLAKMILLAYARYPEMSIFVIDPQGEFSKDAKGDMGTSGFPLDLKSVFSKLKREVIVKGVRDLILNRWELFVEILCQSKFFELISIAHPNNKRNAAEELQRGLEGKVKLKDLYKEESFKVAWGILGDDKSQKIIYPSKEPRDRFKDVYNEYSHNNEKLHKLYTDFWKPVCELFREREGALSINNLIFKAFGTKSTDRPIVIINLSKEAANDIFWNDTIQALIIKSLLDSLSILAENSYKNNEYLNTLVILDEAHRLAPRELMDNAEQDNVRKSLIDAVRTTRKYGLGWMFISQTLSSLHREIIGQLRIFFFGFGLALGNEFTALKEIAGGDMNSLKLYQSFRDPHSAFDIASRQYSFMSVGPVSPLSFAGTPLFFTVFNEPDEFLRANNLL